MVDRFGGLHCRPPNPPLGYLQARIRVASDAAKLYHQSVVQAGKPMATARIGIGSTQSQYLLKP